MYNWSLRSYGPPPPSPLFRDLFFLSHTRPLSISTPSLLSAHLLSHSRRRGHTVFIVLPWTCISGPAAERYRVIVQLLRCCDPCQRCPTFDTFHVAIAAPDGLPSPSEKGRGTHAPRGLPSLTFRRKKGNRRGIWLTTSGDCSYSRGPGAIKNGAELRQVSSLPPTLRGSSWPPLANGPVAFALTATDGCSRALGTSAHPLSADHGLCFLPLHDPGFSPTAGVIAHNLPTAHHKAQHFIPES